MRARLLHKVLPTYLVAVVPAFVMVLGAVFLLEINYRLATSPELGRKTTFLSIPVDMSTPWPWLAGVAVLVVGYVGFRRSMRLVTGAWSAAGERVQARETTP
jgi:branched-chain amino acid transport system permease protein